MVQKFLQKQLHLNPDERQHCLRLFFRLKHLFFIYWCRKKTVSTKFQTYGKIKMFFHKDLFFFACVKGTVYFMQKKTKILFPPLETDKLFVAAFFLFVFFSTKNKKVSWICRKDIKTGLGFNLFGRAGEHLHISLVKLAFFFLPKC